MPDAPSWKYYHIIGLDAHATLYNVFIEKSSRRLRQVFFIYFFWASIYIHSPAVASINIINLYEQNCFYQRTYKKSTKRNDKRRISRKKSARISLYLSRNAFFLHYYTQNYTLFFCGNWVKVASTRREKKSFALQDAVNEP